MKLRIAAVLVVLLGLLSWVFLRGDSRPADPASPGLLGQSGTVASSSELAGLDDADSREAARATSGSSAPRAKLAKDQCEVRGRCLLPDGSKAAGVLLTAGGFAADQDRVKRYGAPPKLDPPTMTTGSDGRFSLVFMHHLAFSDYFAGGKLDGYCRFSWRWSAIEPGQVIDVGDVRLIGAGSITVRVVDERGRALLEGWRICAEGAPTSTGSNAPPSRICGEPDAKTGECVLTGLPEGNARLSAQSAFALVEGHTTVKAGETVRVDLVYKGPDTGTRITVVVSTEPFSTLAAWDFEVFLTAPGFQERKGSFVEKTWSTHVFDDVPAGVYTLEIRDPKVLPWSQANVQPGMQIVAKLKGSAAITLRVVDDATGEPVQRYELAVLMPMVYFKKSLAHPSRNVILKEEDEPPADGFFDGLFPHDQSLDVRATGYSPCTVRVAGLAPGERRTVEARLGRGHAIRGTVVESPDRRPFADAVLRLSPWTEKPDRHELLDEVRSDAKGLRSDAAGAFAFTGLAPGAYRLSAGTDVMVQSSSRVDMGADADVTGLEVVLPATGRLLGRLIAPDGSSFAGVGVVVMPAVDEQDDPFSRNQRSLARLYATVDSSGSFRSTPVPAGRVRVTLVCPSYDLVQGGQSVSMFGPRIDLGAVDVRAGEDTPHDFDVRARFPAPVDLRVRVNGKPVAGLTVDLRERKKRHNVDVATDATGNCRIGGLPPGTYDVVVWPSDKAWVFASKGAVVVRAGTPVASVLDITLFDGTLSVTAAETHRPLAGAVLSLGLDEDIAFTTARVTTDAEGRASLSLPEGRWLVTRGDTDGPFRPELRAKIDWGPSGPTPDRVELKDRPR